MGPLVVSFVNIMIGFFHLSRFLDFSAYLLIYKVVEKGKEFLDRVLILKGGEGWPHISKSIVE